MGRLPQLYLSYSLYELLARRFQRHAFDEAGVGGSGITTGPRVLYLGGTQLFWECYEARACETYPDGLPPNMLPSWTAREAVSGLLNKPGCRSDVVECELCTKPKNDLWTLWKAIVEVYSAKKLTYTSGKLVAISGIIKLMEEIYDDQYCAGLWRKDLVMQLFWASRFPEQRLRPRPKPYRAPSWSWASLDCPISQPFYDESLCTEVETLISITECKVESTTGDTTSSVMGGTSDAIWLACINATPPRIPR